MSYILKIKNVCKNFGNLKAVHHLSFNVEEGQILGIAGPNGAGKTTLFNLITGIPYNNDSGEIYFNELPIHFFPAHKKCHLGIARTFQREAVFETLTVFENVMIACVYGNKNAAKKDKKEIAYRALEVVELNKKTNIHKKANHLSLFDKKKLMLASALAMNPKILFLDEPASGLSDPEIKEMIEIIRKLNQNNLTIIVIEHILPLLTNLSDKIMVINEGQKLIEGLPKKIFNDSQVIEAYLGRKEEDARSNAKN